jgi:phenylalanyl-tRNA synthetase alpha subunit
MQISCHFALYGLGCFTRCGGKILRFVCIYDSTGRVFRNEAISARAHCIFHQVEGLYIDKNVSFADLKQAVLLFAREMFGENAQIRLRPSYFPFTEPSAEVDVSCNICKGKLSSQE